MTKRPHKVQYTEEGKKKTVCFTNPDKARAFFEFHKELGHTPASLTHTIYKDELGIEGEDIDWDEEFE